jgi:hypothetical protein
MVARDSQLSSSARRRLLRRQFKGIRRKIEVAEHGLAAALPVGQAGAPPLVG